MQIDRRITNGLAWAGAALVVAIPLADYVSGQFFAPVPQVALADTPRVAPQPAPASQRPQVAQRPVTATPVAPVVSKPAAPAAQPDRVTTASTKAPAETSAGDAVDAFLKSGRALPSYISDVPGTTATPARQPIAVPAVPAVPAVQPLDAPAAAPASVEVAAVAPVRIAPTPMPASMRPAAPVPVLIVDDPEAVVVTPDMVSAADLEDWESGPLSEFLARRQQQGGAVVVDDYDPDGFFLDQGPNSEARMRVVPVR